MQRTPRLPLLATPYRPLHLQSSQMTGEPQLGPLLHHQRPSPARAHAHTHTHKHTHATSAPMPRVASPSSRGQKRLVLWNSNARAAGDSPGSSMGLISLPARAHRTPLALPASRACVIALTTSPSVGHRAPHTRLTSSTRISRSTRSLCLNRNGPPMATARYLRPARAIGF